MMWDPSNDDIGILAASVGVTSALGAILVICSYVLFPDCRTFSRKLVALLSVCDLLQGLFFLTVFVHKPSWCSVFSAWGIFAATSQFFWTACIAYYVYKVVSNPEADLSYLMPYFYTVSFGYPVAFLAVLIGLHRSFAGKDSDVPWCYIQSKYKIWRLMAVYIPLFLAWVVTFGFYFYARHLIGRIRSTGDTHTAPTVRARGAGQLEQSKPSEHELKEVQNKLIIIPLVFFCVRVWGCAYRIMEVATDKEDLPNYKWLEICTAIGDPSQGLFNCIIFVFLTRRVRRKFAAALCCQGSTSESSAADEHSSIKSNSHFNGYYTVPLHSDEDRTTSSGSLGLVPTVDEG